MPIAVGEQVGPFVIRQPLGKGGMGEVYLALDPRLGRDVAIKILPAEAVASVERRASFVQEAKLASALNHRNIITIYDIDTAEVDGKHVDFIAMEYVHGRTLDQVIGRRGLRLTEALGYAQQIADGLSAAHRVGIIHRDLKPTNIIVNDNGEIKILDFGLAKLIESDEADAWAPTQSVPMETGGGTIAGTAAYMSPEQAEGQWVDERSDIFSFGAVLYEMFTGRRAFTGASKLSTLASVLHRSRPSHAGTGAVAARVGTDHRAMPAKGSTASLAKRGGPEDRHRRSVPGVGACQGCPCRAHFSKLDWTPDHASFGLADSDRGGARRGCIRCLPGASSGSTANLPAFDVPARQRGRSKVRPGRHCPLQRSVGIGPHQNFFIAARQGRISPTGSSRCKDSFH